MIYVEAKPKVLRDDKDRKLRFEGLESAVIPKFISLEEINKLNFVSLILNKAVDITFKTIWTKQLLGGSIQYIFGLIKGIQFNTFLSLIDIDYPASLNVYLQK